MFIYRIAGFSFEGLFLMILCSLFVIAVVSDLLYMRVPNELFLFFFPLFAIYRTLEPLLIWWEGTASLIFCILLFSSLDYFKPNSMGGADMKMFSVLAFCFGFKPFLLMLFLSCITGMVYAKVFSFRLNEPFPFCSFDRYFFFSVSLWYSCLVSIWLVEGMKKLANTFLLCRQKSCSFF